ncbi:hypothetical protein BU14_0070s0052 [Porphyra umbilicalis]|uniref:Aspartate-semialdehyde dehydrogenase n=1 Tax=Porphyra umbilicalis TaxID=2786 RepID=A0A1X6PG91_PORUM|nr:hypothetical protein BU14_0070s0052 [Porphyra umbilicalis]|eukprot:OSX79877.1 hypothetical protein BU14_0070s0052 [Porphyra umbilicalis]
MAAFVPASAAAPTAARGRSAAHTSRRAPAAAALPASRFGGASLAIDAAASAFCGGGAARPVAAVASRTAAVALVMAVAPGDRVKVGVLGCTGSVGQRFLALLEGHPWFEVSALGASPRSAGKPYAEAANWKQATPIPASMAGLTVSECSPTAGAMADCAIIFSGLDASVAGEVEDAFAAAGAAVFSNAKNHRMDADVPILIPPVNAEHVDILAAQRKARGWTTGCLVTNANCSTTALTIALAPIHRAFGIKSLTVATMQAISGSGYPGLSGMDILDNVVPHIGGEEEKMEEEATKILGGLSPAKDAFAFADLAVSAMCNRVHVLDGHTEAVSLTLDTKATPAEVIAAIEAYPAVSKDMGLPSAPAKDVAYTAVTDRPQPRLDRMLGGGFTVSVGRVRGCNIADIRLVCMGHNTIVGAAGGSILNAELCVTKGLIG